MNQRRHHSNTAIYLSRIYGSEETVKYLKPTQSYLFPLIILLATFAAVFLVPAIAYAQDTGATLSIPSLNVTASIVEVNLRQFPNGKMTWDTQALGMNVGHLENTAWLDTPGNIVLGGHSELAQRTQGVFYMLVNIKMGDSIMLTRGEDTRQYIVTQIYQVDFDDLSPVYPTASELLTLITCDTGSYNTSNGNYNRRMIVVAERAG
jgi:LPXTG-site transpeptidase (sortase) family protein